MPIKNQTEQKLRWDVIFFFNAISAGIISVSVDAPVAVEAAKAIFYLFMIFFVLTLFDLYFHKILE